MPQAEDAVGRLRAPPVRHLVPRVLPRVFRFGQEKKKTNQLVSRTNACSRRRSSGPQRSAGWRRLGLPPGARKEVSAQRPLPGRALLTAATWRNFPASLRPAPRDAAGADSRRPAQPSAAVCLPLGPASRVLRGRETGLVSVCLRPPGRPAGTPIGTRSVSARAEDPERARCGPGISELMWAGEGRTTRPAQEQVPSSF